VGPLKGLLTGDLSPANLYSGAAKLARGLAEFTLPGRLATKRQISKEQTFVESLDVLESALDHLNQGLVMVDATGHILIFNQRAAEYSGVRPREFPWPAPAGDVFRAQWQNGEFGVDGQLLPEDVRQLFLTGSGVMPKSYVRRRPDGTVLEVRTESLPNGGYVQTYSDITALIQAKEEAEAAARVKADFLAAMSHEIRTPLNGVLGIAALLSKTPLTGEQRNWVRIILQSGDTLVSLINDILDFSKLDAGNVEFDPVASDLPMLVQATLDVIEPQVRAKSLSLNVNLAADVPQWAYVDGKRLRQVLFNLLGNAVKFTDRGNVTLSLTKAGHNEPQRLRFEIRDTGIGIAAESLQRLFRKFSQVDASINRRFGGTGLGLAICKKIVEGMGGTIGVESQQGVGSCFWFEIDARPCDAQFAREETAATMPVSHQVLLVEDMPVNQIVARGMLASLGHSVSLANDGDEALEMLKGAAYDLILMDMQMPRMNGLEATRAIRAQGGTAAGIPIIAMTANAFHSDRSLCLAAGMNDFVAKPIELGELAAAIRRVLPAGDGAPEKPPSGKRAFDPDRLAHLAKFVGPAELQEIFDDFAGESEQILRELRDAVAERKVDRALDALELLQDASLAIGLTDSLGDIAEIRRLMTEDASVGNEALDSLRAAVLQSRRDGFAWLAALHKKHADKTPARLAAL
jgi:signal transduction histidine kinase/CheY-like chemotaxis protein